jgi:ribosomal protein S18 acetylase RimI-like enzyme
MPTPEIRPIPAEMTHDLRHRVLRPHQPLAEMAYPGDDDPGTFHLGAFPAGGVGGAVPLGIVSMYAEPMPGDPRAGDLRLRGMAVEPGRQGRGLGAALVAAALTAARQAGGRRVWCNARTPAAGFYSRLGFTVAGEPFDLPGIGEHYVMWIALAQGQG